MSRSCELFGEDIEDAALKILQRTRRMSLDAFVANDVLFDAVQGNEGVGAYRPTIQASPLASQRLPPDDLLRECGTRAA